MKTIELKIYQFSELSEYAKQKAIENLSDINVDYNWWEFIYEDAKNVGLKIEGFDLYEKKINMSYYEDSATVKKLISKTHGKKTDTYKTVKGHDLRKEGEADEMLKALAKDYLNILNEEYNYNTSNSAIIDSIEANEYEFTEDGELWQLN
ncbi:MAG: hypothetical protein ACOC33_03205 [bacterium]